MEGQRQDGVKRGIEDTIDTNDVDGGFVRRKVDNNVRGREQSHLAKHDFRLYVVVVAIW